VATQLGITLVKKMTYRGDPNEEWSNTYWFDGTPPTTQTQAQSFVDDLASHEKTLVLGTVTYLKAYVFNDNAPTAHAAFVVPSFTSGPITGTMTTGTGTYPAGDQAAWIRWLTSRRTSKGRPIYLRKYYHGVPTDEDSPTTVDNVSPSWATAAGAFATLLQGGSLGYGKIVGRGHASDVITAHSIAPFIGIRQLKKGRKRPPV
jgi:hypothetical protein